MYVRCIPRSGLYIGQNTCTLVYARWPSTGAGSCAHPFKMDTVPPSLFPSQHKNGVIPFPLCQSKRLTLNLSAGFNVNFSILSKVKKKITIPLRAFRISLLCTVLFTNHPFFFWMVGFLINLQKFFIIKGN